MLALEVFGAAAALGLLGLHISLLGRGIVPLVAAAGLVTLLLLVTFDLDRPTRGLIKIPDTPLVATRASMALPPAAHPSTDHGSAKTAAQSSFMLTTVQPCSAAVSSDFSAPPV